MKEMHMGSAIGGILPLAIGVALSPIPIIAIVLMLGTPRARSNGPAFTLGWLVGLTVVGSIMLVIGSGDATQSKDAPATWSSVLLLMIGVLLLLLAARTWHKRPTPGQDVPTPKWMQTLDDFTAGKALVAGVGLSAVINPKNLLLTVAAGVTIAQAGISTGQEAIALGVFVLVGSLTILGPLGIYLTMGANATRILSLKMWMAAHNQAIMTVLFLVIGAKLIGDGISGLTS